MQASREYYPTMEEEIVVLECVWNPDKFVLLETSGKGKISQQGGSSEIVLAPGTGAFMEGNTPPHPTVHLCAIFRFLIRTLTLFYNYL